MTSLNLKEPKAGWPSRPAGPAEAGAPGASSAEAARAEHLKAELRARTKEAVELAMTLPLPGRKALAATLKGASDESGQTKDGADAGARARAYETALAKVDAAVAQARSAPNGASALPAAAGAKADAAELRPLIEKKQAEVRADYARLRPLQARFEKDIEAAKANKARRPELPGLEQRKKQIDDLIAPIDRSLAQLDADAKALDDPRSTAKTYNDIRARQQTATAVAAAVQVDHHDSEIERQQIPTEAKTTRVTTAYDKGTSTTRTETAKTAVGLGGPSHEVIDKTEVVGKDGKKHGSEDKTTFKADLGGATRTDSATESRDDGSSSTRSRTTGVERGKGKLGTVDIRTSGETDAAGTSQTTTTTTRKGLTAGPDGVCAYADREKKFENKRANGFSTGAVAGLSGNIKCNVVAKGGEPPKFQVSISIDLGMRAGLSAGREKEGGSVKGSVGVNASQHVVMSRTRTLSEAETTAYVGALKAGGGGTGEEFRIIAVGLSQTWEAARDLYLAMSGEATGKAQADQLAVGESIEVSKQRKLAVDASVGGSGKGMGGGLEAGLELTEDESRKVARDKNGKLIYENKRGDGETRSGGVKANIGVLQAGVKLSRTSTTTTGYKIEVDPKSKNAAAMQEALDRCHTQAELDAFAEKYPKTVLEKTTGTSSAQNTGATLAAGPVGAGFNVNNQNSVEETVDRDGKVVRRVVTGGSGGGGEVSAFGWKLSSTKQDLATAESDADGNVLLDASTTETSTNFAKLLDSKLSFNQGALKEAGGAAEDTDDHDINGIILKNNDLGHFAFMAKNKPGEWLAACPSPSHQDDWEAARKAIARSGGDKAVVAEELAKFVGKDSGRNRIIEDAARPNSGSTVGNRKEFPGGLQAIKAGYKSLVVIDSEKGIDAIAKKDGAEAAVNEGNRILAELESIYNTVSSAQGESAFSREGVRGEMLSAITTRRQKVKARLHVLKGGSEETAATVDRTDQYNSLLTNCINHKNNEAALFAKIEKTFEGGSSPDLGDTVVNAEDMKQLQELHVTWGKDYAAMAEIAEDMKIGTDRYWKYKPNARNLQRLIAGSEGVQNAPEQRAFDASQADFKSVMEASGLYSGGELSFTHLRSNDEYNAIVSVWQAETKAGSKEGKWRPMVVALVAKARAEKARLEGVAKAKADAARAAARKLEQEHIDADLADRIRLSMQNMEGMRKAATGNGNVLNNKLLKAPNPGVRKTSFEKGDSLWREAEKGYKQLAGRQGESKAVLARQLASLYVKADRFFQAGLAQLR